MENRVRAYLEHVARDCERWVTYIRSRAPRDLRRSVAPADVLGVATERALRYSESTHGESEAKLDAWFRSIIRNVIRDLIDEQNRREEELRQWAEERERAIGKRPQMEHLADSEFIDRLDSALTRLSADAVALFTDRVLSKKSFAELAGTRGITEAAARLRFYRIRKRLEQRVMEGRKEGRKEAD